VADSLVPIDEGMVLDQRETKRRQGSSAAEQPQIQPPQGRGARRSGLPAR
jgi:hypothetical protein